MPLPNFLGIGAVRCGTTWIYEMLRAHPEVYMPPVKEIRFFDGHYSEGVAWYEQFFKEAKGEKAIGEFSPSYLGSPEADARIKNALPGVKLIVSLRNPIDRAYSQFWWSMGTRGADLSKIAEDGFERALQSSSAYVEAGLYANHLTRYLELFGQEQIHVILFDDIVSDPAQVAVELFAFLGINPSFLPSDVSQQVNPTAQYRSRLLRRGMLWMARKAEKIGLLRLVIWAKQIGLRDMLMKLLERPVEYPPIPEGVRQRLEASFAEDIAKLEKLLNKDLSNWRGGKISGGTTSP